ncbi:class I SAM-dependent methyltransferase [Salininema proteolyticum]|uniref:Class I SAM-dependent methyltransferase n=1 Tax=Salininema proteolyticum TaxID=1607685 RepID=A0ABV8U1P8_9ACTN
MKTVKNLGDVRRFWNRQSEGYDRKMRMADEKFFGDTRSWLCGRARGETLEVAVGTGLNLAHYPDSVELTGIELSPEMLRHAEEKAEASGRGADLRVGDAQSLDFPDGRFDSVVCTFSLCAIPDERRAVEEMVRVLKPGGRLLLADHVIATSAWIRAIQRVADLVSIPFAGEHFRRRPYEHVKRLGLTFAAHTRFKKGLVERFEAVKPE